MAYGRIYKITVITPTGFTLTIDNGDVDFSCTRDNEEEPNEATLTIYGLTADTQNQIAVAGSLVTVAAGYKDEGMPTLFQGELSSAVTIKNDEVYALEIRLHESLIPYRASTTSRTFAAGSSLNAAVQQVAKDMGLGAQLSPAAKTLNLSKNLSIAALSREVLASLCAQCDAAWSIQYQSVIVTAGDAITAGAASISPESGLLGTPRLKIHTPKRRKKSSKTGKTAKSKKTVYPFPPPGAQTDYSSGARRQIGVIEGIVFRSVLRGGIEVGDTVELISPSLGTWWVVITSIKHRFGTRDHSVWETEYTGVIE